MYQLTYDGAVVLSEAVDDAAAYGTGFIQVLPDGSLIRLDPAEVMLASSDGEEE